MTDHDKKGVFRLDQLKGNLSVVLARVDTLVAKGYAIRRNELRNILKSLDVLDVHAVAKSVSEIVHTVIRKEGVFVAYLGALSPESDDLIALELYVDLDQKFKASVLIYEVVDNKLVPYPNAIDILFAKHSHENHSEVLAGIMSGMNLLLDIVEGKTTYYDSLTSRHDSHLN